MEKKSTQPRNGSLEINKIYKFLTKPTKGQKDSIQINKIRNKRGDLATETEVIKKKSSYLTTSTYTQPIWKS